MGQRMSGDLNVLDRVSRLVFGREFAGACIPENGQQCACYYGYSYCYAAGKKYDVYEIYRYNCTGSCNYAGGTCRQVSVSDPRCH